MEKLRRLLDEYRFPGFRPRAGIAGLFGDPKARVIRLERRQKKRHVGFVERLIRVFTTRDLDGYGIYLAGMPGYIWSWKFGESSAASVEK
jgi:hypothetical protein